MPRSRQPLPHHKAMGAGKGEQPPKAGKRFALPIYGSGLNFAFSSYNKYRKYAKVSLKIEFEVRKILFKVYWIKKSNCLIILGKNCFCCTRTYLKS